MEADGLAAVVAPVLEGDPPRRGLSGPEKAELEQSDRVARMHRPLEALLRRRLHPTARDLRLNVSEV